MSWVWREEITPHSKRSLCGHGVHVRNVATSIAIIVRAPYIALCFCTFLLNTSCTGSSPGNSNGVVSVGGNKPPVIRSATILENPIQLDHPIEVQIDAQDPEREAVSFRYQWYADDMPLAQQIGATLPAELLKRGQMISVEVTPLDGSNTGQPYRTKGVVVGNTPPSVMAITLLPQTAQPGVRLEAQVDAGDLDRDMVDLVYKWYRNETVVKEGRESFLDTTGLAVRDSVTVEVIPRDAMAAGNPRKSDPVILGNSAPRIVSSPPIAASQDRYDYSVRAVDPDGDRLTYQLEVSPPGMTIGAESGHIVWHIPQDQQGTFHVKVAARDGAGGLATQEFDVTLTLSAPAGPSGA